MNAQIKPEHQTNEFDKTKIHSVKESAAHLGISERQLWREIHHRRIETVTLGGRRRGITQGALVDFIKERTIPKFNPSDIASKILAG